MQLLRLEHLTVRLNKVPLKAMESSEILPKIEGAPMLLTDEPTDARRFSKNNHGVQDGAGKITDATKSSKRSFAKEVNFPRTSVSYSADTQESSGGKSS